MKKIIRVLLVISIIIFGFGIIKYFIPTGVSEISNKDKIESEIKFDYTPIKVDNKASVLMNLDTNQIIYSNNMHNEIPVYSVSKVMFLATVAKKMEEENISYNKKVKVTKLIDTVNTQGNFSSAGLGSNEVYTIKELFDAVMIPSGNDAAILLAYELFNNHESAVVQMNENAKKWKMKDSSFVSTSGLDGKYLNKIGIKASPGKNLMSPYDSVLLVKRVMKNYPEIVDSGNKKTSTIGKYNSKSIKLENVNEILEGLDYSYSDVYGLKTGSNIEKYSNCIIALKKNEYNQTILAISYSSKTRQSLYEDITSLYDYLKTLNLTNLQDNIELNTKVGFVENDVKFGLEKPFYIYHNEKQDFEYKLIDISKKYNKNMNRFYGINKDGFVGDLEIINKEEFFDGTPLNLSSVIVSNELNKKGVFKSIQEFVIDLIKK
ncbi:D-alanyl-D-alanine carboxypeptidase [Bacilli bacterium PM5-3]|nr:D-alanyl-D-alanine carboxypeptidase [Bacilli bacterium PM5-3]MDH6603190.1 D-alanyl-D-alanine carboxypeptidase [Bacilli bacterium PM5-9]